MQADSAIIRPFAGKHPASIGKCCVMASHPADLDLLVETTGMGSGQRRPLLNSRLSFGPADPPQFSLIGPFIGAPYAVMLMETVIAWGVAEIILFGWCGAVSKDIRIGDIILPRSAFIDEGASRHYSGGDAVIAYPDSGIQDRIRAVLSRRKAAFMEGAVWTTDAVFRETPEKMSRYQKQGALAVEMECSALFSVGAFRSATVGCVLVVSDDISSGVWTPGFHEQRFKAGRRMAVDVIADLLTAMADPRNHQQCRGKHP